jgi:hypothetical protein
MPKGDTIKKWGFIIVGLAIVCLIGYKAYTLHYSNTVWCVSHQISCSVARLKTTAVELESAK